jgi:hypothetical protein
MARFASRTFAAVTVLLTTCAVVSGDELQHFTGKVREAMRGWFFTGVSQQSSLE